MNEPSSRSRIKKTNIGKMATLRFSILVCQLLAGLCRDWCYGLQGSHPPQSPKQELQRLRALGKEYQICSMHNHALHCQTVLKLEWRKIAALNNVCLCLLSIFIFFLWVIRK